MILFRTTVACTHQLHLQARFDNYNKPRTINYVSLSYHYFISQQRKESLTFNLMYVKDNSWYVLSFYFSYLCFDTLYLFINLFQFICIYLFIYLFVYLFTYLFSQRLELQYYWNGIPNLIYVRKKNHWRDWKHCDKLINLAFYDK